MPADFLLKVADVIDQTAAFIDGQESAKQLAVRAARESAAKAFAVKFAEATGDELPEDVLQKLAASDEDVLTTVSKLVEKTGAVESLGSSSDKTASAVPMTKKERAEAAYERFGSFINS
jgi:hypothetical protein